MADFGYHTTGNEVVARFPERVRGKTFLVTGPSPGGIGAETVRALATGKPRLLILTGRSESKIKPVLDELQEQHPDVKTQFIHLELDSLASVRKAAASIRALGTPIDGALINNAGIMNCPYRVTVDGIESQFATNHIGHFLLTMTLLQDGVISNGARIINISSSAHAYPSRPFETYTYNDGKDYEGWKAYRLSKAANVEFTRSLAQKLAKRDIQSFSLHPGRIKSGLQQYTSAESMAKAIQRATEANPDFQPTVWKTFQEGCSTTLRAALDPSLASESGAYLSDCQVTKSARSDTGMAEADKLWAISEELVGQKFDV